MARITLDIPDELYERLKAAAERNESPLDDAIISTLDTGIGRDEDELRLSAREVELRRLREALSDILADTSSWRGAFKTGLSRAERERILREMPPLDPPLSQTVIEEREEGL